MPPPPGGYFIGTVPDGKRIMAHLAASEVLDEPLLKLTRKWQARRARARASAPAAGCAGPQQRGRRRCLAGPAASPPPCSRLPLPPPQGAPKKYGSAYCMEIKDTVVEGVEGASEGSDEFLVFTSALTKAAAAAGLHPVADYTDPGMLPLFEEGDAGAPFKHFRPQFPEETDKSLALVQAQRAARGVCVCGCVCERCPGRPARLAPARRALTALPCVCPPCPRARRRASCTWRLCSKR